MAVRARLICLLVVVVNGGLALANVAAGQEVNLTGPLSAAQQRTKALCDAADVLVDTNVETNEARRLYLRALRTGAARTVCAAQGLKRIADRKKEAAAAGATATDRARALLRNGFAAEADKELTSLLKDAPKNGEAVATLPTDLDPLERNFEAAKALADQGYDEQSQELVQAALKANPDAEVPEELVKGERRQAWLRTVIGYVGTWIITIGVLGLAALLAALIIRIIVGHLRRSIVPEPFAGGADDAGAAILADVRQKLKGWGKGYGTGAHLTPVIAPEQGLTLPANVSGLVPNANVITDLLGAIDGLLPARRWEVGGHLLPAEPERGVGIAVTVSRRTPRGVLETETVSEVDFQATPDESATDAQKGLAWQRLALPCAALVMFTDRSHRWLWHSEFDRLGTNDWRSFAMASSAATYYKWDLTTARMLYRRAIARDPDFLDAQLGLCIVELKLARGDAAALAAADQRLGDLIDKVNPARDFLWYQAQFWRVVGQIYKGAGEQAALEAKALFDPATTKWWWDPDALPPYVYLAMTDTRRLWERMLGIKPAALAAMADALALGNEQLEGALATRVRSLLNISGTDVDGAAIAAALRVHPGYYRRAGAYNLACYYARIASYDDAFDALVRGLEGGGPDLARDAWSDYALEPLKAEACQARFRAVLAAAGYDAPLPDDDPPGGGNVD